MNDIQKIKSAFCILDYDITDCTDEDIVKIFEDSYIGALAALLIDAGEKMAVSARSRLYGASGEMIGKAMKSILEQIEKGN